MTLQEKAEKLIQKWKDLGLTTEFEDHANEVAQGYIHNRRIMRDVVLLMEGALTQISGHHNLKNSLENLRKDLEG